MIRKTNKELAVDVVLKVIEANHRIPYGPQNHQILSPINLDSICNIISKVYTTLEELDKKNPDKP